jgi:hypothetical protein
MAFKADHPFQFSHAIYFSLADRASTTVRAFTDACVKYLSGHHGQLGFIMGTRALDQHRDVNVTDFDISLHMLFDSAASYQLYQSNGRHEEFITVTAGMSNARRVFDSYLLSPAATSGSSLETEKGEGYLDE